MLHNNSHNKNQLERQLALETLRRKRKKENESAIDDLSNSLTKLKKAKIEDKKSEEIKKKKTVKDIMEEDFIPVKPKDQIPFLTFWTAIEPYFAPLTEEDRSFLLPKENDNLYTIPPLGRHFLDVWQEEEPSLSPTTSSLSSFSSNQTILLKHSITNEDLLKQNISSGYLTERLLSCLLTEKQDLMEDQIEDNIIDSFDYTTEKDIIQFEERLKKELKYIGLFNEEDNLNYNIQEDDEICAEIRAVNKELKEQFNLNEFRKKELLKVVDNQLQYEQYQAVLDTLDTQVETSFIKRFRNQKSKKRKNLMNIKSSLSENTIHAMDKRRAWINALGGIFKDKNMILPTQSIYDSLID